MYEDLRRRVAAIPGVQSAVLTRGLPMQTAGTPLVTDDADATVASSAVAGAIWAGPGYFDLLRIPILFGRPLDERDRPDTPRVAVISETMARQYFGAVNVVGRRFRPERDPNGWMEVVGVVGNLRENPDEDIPGTDAWYLPYRQPTAGPITELTYVVKTSPDASIIPSVRNAVAQSDPDVPIFDAVTMEERFARFTVTERLSANLTAMLGVMGVFLAGVGVYAVLAFSVRRRLPELGIRAALGARPSDVRRSVLREATLLVVVGVAVGATVSVFVRPLLDANLFPIGVSQSAAVALAGAGVVLTATISTIVPAIRASRVDPVRALAGR